MDLRRVLLCLFLSWVTLPAVFAQVDTGTIAGSVRDSQGAGVPAATVTRDAFVTFLTRELGTDNIDRAKTYMEDPLRMTVHLIMSTAEYQIV